MTKDEAINQLQERANSYLESAKNAAIESILTDDVENKKPLREMVINLNTRYEEVRATIEIVKNID